MISKEDIQVIYDDCRAILLLQDDQEKEMPLLTLVSDYNGLSDHKLEELATEAGYSSVCRFLNASKYFNLLKRAEQVYIKLADGSAKAKTTWNDDDARKVPDNVEKSVKRKKLDRCRVIPMEVDSDPVPNNTKNTEAMDEGDSSSVIIVDDENEVVEVPQPQFIVQIADDARYRKAFERHERAITKHPKDLEQKDLRYLINARKVFSTKTWKNDMFMKLYPDEMENQEKLLAEKYRDMLIRQIEVCFM